MEGSQETPERPPSQHTDAQDLRPQKTYFQKVKEKLFCGIQITLLISLIFYIASLTIGIWGVHKCPVEDNIPFFLIVQGGIGLFSKITSIIRDKILKHYPVQYIESSLYSVELVFLLLGSYWVFKEYKPSFSPNSSRYCNQTVYMFAFAYLAVLYGLIFIMFVSFLCFLGCIYFVERTGDRNQDAESATRPFRNSENEQSN